MDNKAARKKKQRETGDSGKRSIKKPTAGFAMNRRTFNKVIAGSGAALAMGALPSGCGKSALSPPSGTEVRTLHFSFPSLPGSPSPELRVSGKRYQLIPHTDVTRLQASSDLFNASGKIDDFTHFVPDVELSSLKPHVFSVTFTHAQRGPGLLLVAFHIPGEARTKVAAKVQSPVNKRSAAKVCAAVNPVCTLQDQVPDEFLTAFDTAKAIVMHHPEIINLNKDIAAQVEVHIGNSGDVGNLAISICSQGPAYEHDDAYEDGWCVLVPLKNADGTPKLDRYGKQIYDYQFSAQTKEDMKPAIKDVLSRVKNDPALKDKMYAVRPHGVTEDNTLPSKLAARYNLWAAGGVQLAATNTGYHHNVWFQTPTYTGSGATRSFKLKIVNMNFIWYGVYVEYLDAKGKPISSSKHGAMLSDQIPGDQALLSWLESDTVKWVGLITSPPTMFGIPIFPYPTEIDVTMPEGASSARVMLCGPGLSGKVDFSNAIVPGLILTMIMQYALPIYFLQNGTGMDEDKSLWAIFTTGVKLKIIIAMYYEVKYILNPTSTHEASLLGSSVSLMTSMIQQAITLMTSGAMPSLGKRHKIILPL